MSSLVSDFIINPVMRQARRFSSGFATEDHASVQTLQQHHRTRSAGDPGGSNAEVAILEGEEESWTPSTRSGTAPPTAMFADYSSQTQVQPAEPVSLAEMIPLDPTALSYLPPPSQEVEREIQPLPQASPSSAAQPTPATPTRVVRDPTLPEDDGMGHLRRRILAIQATEVSAELKAQLVHQVLLEGYTKARVLAPSTPRLGSPTTTYASPESAEPSGPLHQALKFLNPLGDGSGPLALPLSEEDRRPTYVPTNCPHDHDDFVASLGRNEPDDNGEPALGCQHYRRNVKLQCATCERWHTCRFCHDEAEDHTLPRKETKNMLCMLCGCPQKASDTCIRCGGSAAQYFCGVCKLWNDDPNKPIYHCNDCGLCRVGQGLGKDFFHCKKCMACISMAGGHKCIERSIDCDCPICGEYMFSSPRPVVFMQCGHSIHRRCFSEHMNSSYKCPICNKSCVNMEYQFRNYDIAILTQPMPVEYRDSRAIISCNDCSAKSQTAYHWLGLKCTVCNSYNTIQQQVLNLPGGATTAATGREPLATTTGAFNHGEQRSLTAETALRILSEIRRTQEEDPGLARSRSDSSLSRLHNNISVQAIPGEPSLPVATTSATATGAIAGDLAYLTRANGIILAAETDDYSDAEEEVDVLDFWGNRARYLRSFTSAGEGENDDEDDDDDDNDSSGDECDVDTDEEEDDDANEIVLLGHR